MLKTWRWLRLRDISGNAEQRHRTRIRKADHQAQTNGHHVGINVDDLPAAIAFFTALGLELQGEASVEGAWVDRVIGIDSVRSDIAMLQTPDGQSHIELVKFHSPLREGQDDDQRAPANTPGIRHLTFRVDDLHAVLDSLRPHGAELVGTIEQYEDIFLLCYVRGPQGIIIELAQELG